MPISGETEHLPRQLLIIDVCVPGPDPERWLCHIVDVNRDPPRVIRDDSMEPNDAFRTVGGFH